MASRNPAQMTPEERAAKVDALRPEWARTYIRQLEGITRHLHGQIAVLESRITELRNQGAGDGPDPDDYPDPDEPGQARVECTMHQPLPVPGCTACETMSLAEWKDRYARHFEHGTDTQLVGPDGSVISTSVWTGAGITPPSGDWTVVRVLDGAADMKPLADLPHKAEIRFADAYQVHYGAHESTGGARVLVVETDNAMQVRPVSPNEILIVAMGS